MLSRRRAILATGLGFGTALMRGSADAGPRKTDATPAKQRAANATASDLIPDASTDQSAALQAAIDRAAEKGVALTLPAGRFLARDLKLRPRTAIKGFAGGTFLSLSGDGVLFGGDGADGARLEGLALDGGAFAPASAGGRAPALVSIGRSRAVVLRDLVVGPGRANGIVLSHVSGRVADCAISGHRDAGLFSLDAEGLEIAGNVVSDCGNNGILVWRGADGEDGTTVTGNRIERIRADAGGSGQNGNGVSVFRAASVLVSGNRIADCAYTAVRGNAASNIQMVGNSCSRLGEVALYAEFGFQGALIASNLVDGAATGISVTNFNEGGRLAVVQGNLIRNLRRRENEPEDKRGEGIGVEADAVVTGNTIENAPTAGIVVGWGRYMRDVSVTSNVIRQARVGIMITRDPSAGAALIAQNLISGVKEGGIRAMDRGILTGPELSRVGSQSPRISISGNMLVDA